MPKRLALCLASLIALLPTFAPATTVTLRQEFGAWVAGRYVAFAYGGGSIDFRNASFADIDGDGDLDLFAGSFDPFGSSHRFFQNVGTSQAAVWDLPAAGLGEGAQVVFGDIDGDGDLDAFAGSVWPNPVTFYENVGTSLSAAWGPPVHNYASVLYFPPQVGDIDGDGDLDLFAGRTFCCNVGTTQSPAWMPPVGNYLPALGTLADIDGDGDLDLFAGETSGTITFHENVATTQSPVWGAPLNNYGSIRVDNPINSLAFADIDSDGDLDLFIEKGFGAFTFSENIGTSRSASWAAPVVWYIMLDSGGQGAPAFCDIDADGDQDLFVGNWNSPYGIDFYENVGDEQSPAWGAVSHDYASLKAFLLGDNDYVAPTFADIDADGDLDLFISGVGGDPDPALRYFSNVGTPSAALWIRRTDNFAGAATGGRVAFADIDADGDFDMFIGDDWMSKGSGDRLGLLFYENIGTPNWAVWDWAFTGYAGLPSSWAIEAVFGDLDCDGDLDMVYANPEAGYTQQFFCENIGTAEIAQWSSPTLLVNAQGSPALADIDGDGDLDLFLETGEGGLLFYRNMTFSFAVVPRKVDVEFNTSQQFVVSGTTGTVVWSLVTNPSGGTIDPATGFYTAGPVYNVEDVIEARDPATGDRGRAKVKVVPPPFVRGEKVIICAGGGNFPGNPILTQTNYLADYAFRMSRERGFTSASIYYLNADRSQPHDADGDGLDDVDATATIARLNWAITSWAGNAKRLFLYIVDHGTQTQFRVNETEFLDGVTLDSWLDTLQNDHGTTVILVADFCYSGALLAASTTPPGRKRAVFSSSGSSELAVFLAPYGFISFSNFFLGYAHRGANLFDCLVWTRDALNFTYAGQIPRIDDNGDGLSNKNDGYFALTQRWGFDYGYGATPPEIIEVSPDRVLHGATSVTFQCVVVPTRPVDRVWVTIIAPGMTYESGEPITNIPQIELLTSGTTTYVGSWNGFRQNGQYVITYFAIDDEGAISWPRRAYVIQMSGPDMYEDDNTSTQAKAIVLDWPQAQQHNFHVGGDRDWVHAFLLGGGSYRVTTENVGASCDTVIEVYDSTTATTPLFVQDDWGRGLPETRTWVPPRSGNYYILVHDYDPAASGQGTSYSLRLGGQSGANNGLAIALSAYQVRCLWDAASFPDLQGYHLMRTTDPVGGSWAQVNSSPIAPGANPQFDDGTVEASTTYFYRVHAVRGGGAAPQYTPIFFTTTPEARRGIAVTGGPLIFGQRDVDAGPTPALSVVIRNNGTVSLNFTGAGIARTGANANQFVITNSPPTTPMAAGTSRTVAVAFDPSTTGPKTANLTITTDDTSSPTIHVSLSGTGVDQEITVGPMALAFGALDVDAGSTGPLLVVIWNHGTAPLNFTGVGIALTGANANQFLITNSPATTPLAPGTSRTVAVAFDPTTVGAKAANFTITSDDTDEATVNVSLSGTGVDQEITVSPLGLSFGVVDINAGATGPQTVTIRNDGTAPLSFTGAGIALTGSAAGEFRITNNPTTTPLAVGASRFVSVVFDPSVVGPRAASLRITTDDTDEPVVNVALSGTGSGTTAIRRDWVLYK